MWGNGIKEARVIRPIEGSCAGGYSNRPLFNGRSLGWLGLSLDAGRDVSTGLWSRRFRTLKVCADERAKPFPCVT
jgi:hypothetical protein